MLRKLVLMLALTMSLSVSAQQKITSTGMVSDAAGDPVIGATVKVIGTKIAAVTDVNGKFSLHGVSAGQKLEITYVGMKSQSATIKENMKIVLEDDNSQLDEIVVTAFGQEKRSAFTGSATVIGSDKLEQKQVTNVMSALMGDVTGLEIAPTTSPGKTADITIRGKGSINAETTPLIVLDGMPYEGDWNAINPNDVESVTVLKDAASNSLYGSRGANGVIIITTKKGKSGEAVISFDAKAGCSTRGVPDYDRITNPAEYYEQYYKALYNYKTGMGASPLVAHQYANQNLTGLSSTGGLGYSIYAVPDGEYLIGTNGKLNPNATLGNRVLVGDNVYTLLPDDWTDAAYRTGFRQEYNLSISGGSDKLSLFSSVGYLKDKGIVDNSDYQRYTARLRATYQAKSWLTFGANVSYAHNDQNSKYEEGSVNNSAYAGNSVYSTVANIAPIYPLYARDENGNILIDANGKVYDWGNGVYNTYTRGFLPNTNEIQSLALNFTKTCGNSINLDGYADISFLKDFKFTFKAGTSVWEERYKYAYNPYYGYNATIGGSLTMYHYRTSTINLQQLLNWNHSFGLHNVGLLLGHEYYKKQYVQLDADKTGAADYMDVEELNAYITNGSSINSFAQNYNKEGYFFRAQYNYDEKIYGSFSFRRDASSSFAPSHRWGNFWSVGGAYIISKEDWFKTLDANWITSLKLKASYGQQGNDQIGWYRYVNTYDINNVNGELSLSFKNKGVEDISWEKAGNFNCGVEFELFKSRLTGSIEYYNRKTTDMLMWFSTPVTLGYSGYYQNVGDMRNSGVEMSFNGVIIRTKDIMWSMSANATFNSNKVTYLNPENISTTVDGHDGYQRYNNEFVGVGLPVGTMYMPKYAGVSDKGESMWYVTNSDGSESTTTDYSNATYHVFKMDRPVYGGFGTTVSAYGFDATVQFTYGIGGKGYDYEYALLMSSPTSGTTGYALSTDILNAWTSTNTNTNIPRFQYGDLYSASMSDRFLINNSYLSFQNFQVGYTFKKSVISKLYLTNLRVFVTGDNLYLWSHRKGYDPRLSQGYGICSPMRTISVGVNVKF